MRWNQGWGLPWNDPEIYTIILAADEFGGGCAIEFVAVFSQFYQLVIDGQPSGVPIYCAAGTTTTLKGKYHLDTGPHTASVAGVGLWSSGAFDTAQNSVGFMSGRADRIHLELLGTADADGLFPVKWNLYYQQITPVMDFTTPTAVTYPPLGDAANYASFTSDILPPGTWYVVARQVNAQGVESTNTANQTVLIVTVPPDPGQPYYFSGDASNTVIQFVGSTAPNHNVYDTNVNGIMPPYPQLVVGTGATVNAALAALTNLTFTGTRYVMVRSLSADGIESGNSVALPIQYINGIVQAIAPNPPALQSSSISGRTLTVKFVLDTLNTPAVPATVQLFTSLTPTLDYTTELAHYTIVAITDRFIYGKITGTVGANGNYYFGLRSKTVGGIQSTNTDVYGPVRLSNAVPPAPASVIARGGI